ncbi:MAG: choline/ethanolamine kinase family protein [Kiloniellales bacterium]
MSEEIEQARQALRGVPGFGEIGAVARLGGLTNLVYRAETDGTTVCLRVPGKGTEEYIDREVEAVNARAAARAGVSPEVLHFDAATGLMVTRFLEGTETMTAEAFKTRPGAPGRAGRAFQQLHESGEAFAFRFELFAMIDDYLKILSTKDVNLPEGYHDVVGEAKAVRAALDRNPVALAPCHCDPLCENLLDTGARMWIVDWEYSGMNDPMWDLGDLSVEGAFDPAQDREMMDAYFDGEPPRDQWGRMIIYKAMCDLLWTLWGLIQHANKNPADDFWAYSVNRFERCRTLMADPEFGSHLGAIDQG